MASWIIFLIMFVGTATQAFGESGNETAATALSDQQLIFANDGERIVGGQEAARNSLPWMISLQRNGRHFCGASLISVGNAQQSDVIMTAAHCVVQVTRFTATAGAHDLRRPNSNIQQTVAAARIVRHPNYNSRTTVNDIALVRLRSPIRFSSAIQPVALPQQGQIVAERTQALIAGWGTTREGGSVSGVLLQASVPIVSTVTCTQKYGRRGITIVPHAMVCAGQGGRDSCQGDSGGPLVVRTSSGFVQHGVVSFGVGCARPSFPGVYARVSNYVTWIQNHIRTLSSVAG